MRPEFHFTAQRGWINDPHGITFCDGQYHVFFQYVPDRTVWAPNCHWGHATGPDLFSLAEQPVAIAPGDGDEGIWTGSLVTDDAGRTRILYTSTSRPDIGIGRVRVATPVDEGWLGWRKGGFVADAPEGLDIIAYRDPFVIRDGEGWRMFLGAGLADGTATALSYTSADLEAWDYEGIALQRSTRETEPVWMGALWECPQVIEVDGRWVMVSSVWDDDVLHYAGYAIGDYAGGVFTAESWGRLTYGPSYYAPSFFRDAAGRPCLTFWMRGVLDEDAGWAGAHSVPHELRIEGGRLVAAPHPDFGDHMGDVVADGELPGVAGDVRWVPQPGDRCTVALDDIALVELRAGEAAVAVSFDGEDWEVPTAGDVRLLLDGPVLELSSAAGVFGLALNATGRRFGVSGTGRLAVREVAVSTLVG